VWNALTRVVPAARSFAAELLQKQETVPLTRFNSVVSPYRVFETRRFQLDEFREIRRLVPGAKINDVVLAVCAGGLRRYLEANEEPPQQDLSTLLPVYVREPEAGAASRPEVEWERIMLGVSIADPVQRVGMATAGAGCCAGRIEQDSIERRIGLPLQRIGNDNLGGKPGAREIFAQPLQPPLADVERRHLPACRYQLQRLAAGSGAQV